MTPLPASDALANYYLEARSKLLDLAAIFDRIDRGQGQVANDPKRQLLQQALGLLSESAIGRTEKVQQLFSLPYDPTWPVPKAK